jgi:hypothetical protein
MGMTLLEGRSFDERDDQANAPPVVLVNETFAKQFWRGGRAVGKRIRQPGGTDWYQVIGMLRDEKHYGLDQKMKASVFHPFAPTTMTVGSDDARSLQAMSIILRASMDPKLLLGAVREIVQHLDADVPMFDVQTMSEQLNRSLWARRAYSWLFGTFAIIATLLAAAGVYGMISFVVSQRTQEIGIRVALGAQPHQVLGQVLRSGMTLVSAGIVVGLIATSWAASLLRTLLFGVSSYDPLTYVVVVAGVLAVGLLANLVPAFRAASVDPIRALHFE